MDHGRGGGGGEGGNTRFPFSFLNACISTSCPREVVEMTWDDDPRLWDCVSLVCSQSPGVV